MHFENKKGLHHLSNLNRQHYSFVRSHALATTDPVHFHPEHLYIFGWSGKLDLEERKIAAHDLFYSLKHLCTTIQQNYCCAPEIILISHSHGGNIILHLAEIIDPDEFELSISKAILLACPVQKHTEHLISSPLFKRIYSLHSHTDMIQIADLQGLHNKKKRTKPLLSMRHFNSHPKLSQAAIRWKNCPIVHHEDLITNEVFIKKLTSCINAINFFKKNRGLFHIEFQLLPFIRQLPSIIYKLDELFDANANCPTHKDHDIIIEL